MSALQLFICAENINIDCSWFAGIDGLVSKYWYIHLSTGTVAETSDPCIIH